MLFKLCHAQWKLAARAALFVAVLSLAGTVRALPPTLPSIPVNNFNVTNYGAVGNGSADNTIPIQNAINAAGTAGGGTVEIPAGAFLSGPLTLKSSINLQVDAGAVLRMLPFGTYPMTYATNYTTNGSVVTTNITWTAVSFIGGTNLHDIEISGPGTIDGQGQPWWPYYNTDGDVRPYMFYLSGCNRESIQNITLLNSPEYHIWINGKAGNTTIKGITVTAPDSSASPASHNTDSIDVSGTNILIQDCNTSVGDDNVAVSGGASDILVTNCVFGNGHGVAIGSFTGSGGVSNMTVINCSFNNTQNGIRLKSDNTRGGLVQNINYFNLTMTNIKYFPIIMYSYYENTGNPTWVTAPAIPGEDPSPVLAKTPIWRNITISNVTATVGNSGIAGLIWGRTEMAVSNVVLSKINISAPLAFGIYNAYGIQLLDSTITVPSGAYGLGIYNTGLTVSNSASGAGNLNLQGLPGTNTLALYRAPLNLIDTNLLGADPLTVSASVLIASNNLALPAATDVNFVLGTNAAQITVTGNLALNARLNVTNGGGFAPGTYTLFTYLGALSGSPVLGSTPPNYICSLDTSSAHKVRVQVQAAPLSRASFGRISRAGNQLVMSGAGGPTNGTYLVLTSSNVSLPLSNWTRLLTNQFDASGNFSVTNTPASNAPAIFYGLEQLP